MLAKPSPTTFFSLPRELRDQVYWETLSDHTATFTLRPAENSPGVWFPVRRTSPGFYRPIIHMHMCKGRQHLWDHKTDIVARPALFDVTSEAVSLYMRDHVMLELINSDCERVTDEWVDRVGPAGIDMIRTLYTLVHACAVLEPSISPSLKDAVGDDERPEIDGPIFRIELRDGGERLVVRSKAELSRLHKGSTARSVGAWAAARLSSPAGAAPFTGRDLVEVGKRLNHRHGSGFCFRVRERQVVDVSHYVCVGIRSSVLELLETYDYVVAEVSCTNGKTLSLLDK